MKWLEKLTGLDKVRKEAEEKLAQAEEQEM